MIRRTAAALTLLALVAALAVALLASPAVASHGEEQADFTVHPGSHDTGAEDVSYELDVELTDTVDRSPTFAYPDRIAFVVQGATLDGCGSDDFWSGTNYELGVNRSTADGYDYQSYTVGDVGWDGNVVVFTFDDSDNDDQPNYGQGDVLELDLDACVTNPDEDDWYLAGVNVTGGSRTDRTVTFDRTVPSHYFGICDGCESDADARESMGNPPSEPTPTPTATATPSPTPIPTATPTDAVDPTPRPNPTDSPEPTETPTDTPTETDGAGDGEPTTSDAADAEVLGMNPLAVVGIVAVVSLGLAALGARRL